MPRGILRVAVCALLAIGIPPTSDPRAEDAKVEKLDRIERAIANSRAREQRSARDALDLQAEIDKLRYESVRKARLERRREAKVASLERELRGYRREAQAREHQLATRRDELAASLAALQRLSRKPPAALLASPASAVDSVRSSILIGSLSQRLQADAERLGAQLDALRRLRNEIAAKKNDLANNSANLERERRELDRLIKRKAKARARLKASAQREANRQSELAGEAKTLRALVERIAATNAAKRKAERDRSRQAKGRETAALTPPAAQRPKLRTAPKSRPPRSFKSARGQMPFPATGSLLSGFGEPDVGRTRTKGVKIATPSGAPVVAPHDGEIVFAGRFRSYGQLLIIAHGGGYHTLVAGLSRIDVTVGQMLLAGEPVGRMAEESSKNPVLYVEMRRNGAPFDPLPWLADLEREVSG